MTPHDKRATQVATVIALAIISIIGCANNIASGIDVLTSVVICAINVGLISAALSLWAAKP